MAQTLIKMVTAAWVDSQSGWHYITLPGQCRPMSDVVLATFHAKAYERR